MDSRRYLKSSTIRKAAALAVMIAVMACVSVAFAGNPYSYNVADNCRWYAWEQAYDRMGVQLPTWGNPGAWLTYAQDAGFPTGDEAKEDALVIWTDDGVGHVAYVTDVSSMEICVIEGGRSDYPNGIQSVGEWAPKAVGASRWGEMTLQGYIYLEFSNIVFNANGGAGAPESMRKAEGETITIPYETPTRSGYTFFCWNDSPDGKGVNTLYPGDEWSRDVNITFYAIWQVETHTITYDANGGTGAPSKQTFYGDGAITLSSVKPTRSGYEFQGWSTSATAKTPEFLPASSYSSSYFGDSTTLYAVWKELVSYTVFYDANGGTGAPAEQTFYDTVTLSSVKPTRTGYQFQGWSTSPGATEATYQPGDIYSGGIATMYAVWTPRTYTVSFQSAGGIKYDPIERAYGEAIGELPEPARTGYFFQGWKDEDGAQVTADTKVYGNMTLTAEWKKASAMVLPENLTVIDDEAFRGVAANAIVVPDSVTTIGEKAFAGSGSLNSLVVYSREVTPAVNAFDGCPDLTIYGYRDTPIEAYAKESGIPFVNLRSPSEWAPYSEMPAGADVLAEKWTYNEVKRTTSSSGMSGWTLAGTEWRETASGLSRFADFPAGFNTNNALYTKYSPANKATEKETETSKTVLGNDTVEGYIYWHWSPEGAYAEQAESVGHAINAPTAEQQGTDGDGWNHTRFSAFEVGAILDPVTGTGVGGKVQDLTGDGLWSTCYHSAYNLAKYVSHWWYTLEIHHQPYTNYEKVYIYTREMESDTEVQPGDSIADVQHLVRYGY